MARINPALGSTPVTDSKHVNYQNAELLRCSLSGTAGSQAH